MDDTFVLGVVMPVFNEEIWVGRTIDGLLAAARESNTPLEIVAVDDGSTDGTGAVLDARAARGELTVIHTPNRGRFAARLTGLQSLTTEHALLLDSRVHVHEGAVSAIRHHLAEAPDQALCAHVEIPADEQIWGTFWFGLAKVFWRAYFVQSDPIVFGLENFDRYPKGTTAFVARRATLLSSADRFTSLFENAGLSSDDTGLLREVARHGPIRVGRDFSITYFGKDTARKWVRQAYFRGTTFVDGYVGTRQRARRYLAASAVVAPLGVSTAVKAPRATAAALVAGMLTAGVITRSSGGTPREARVVATLFPAFIPPFTAGLVRGLWLAVRRR